MKTNIKQIYQYLLKAEALVDKQENLKSFDIKESEKIIDYFRKIHDYIVSVGEAKFESKNRIFLIRFIRAVGKYTDIFKVIKEAWNAKLIKSLVGKHNIKKPVRTLTSCEIYIYEMLTLEKIRLDKKPDHRHYHYYYTENKNGIGRWRRYEDIINYITLTIYKMVMEKNRTLPYPTKKGKMKLINLRIPDKLWKDFMEFALKTNQTISDVVMDSFLEMRRDGVKEILGKWKKIA